MITRRQYYDLPSALPIDQGIAHCLTLLLLTLVVGIQHGWMVAGVHETVTTNPPSGIMAYASKGGIYLMETDGSNARLLIPNLPSGYWDHPAWSPDGSKLAFTLFPSGEGVSQIYTANADGSGLRPLTTDPSGSGGAHWSPDGTQIVYAGFADANEKIFLMNADGSAPHPLTTDKESNNAWPTWSPDGKQIAFASSCGLSIECNGVVAVNIDGTGRHTIHSATLRRGDGSIGFYVDSQPAWSPDGRQIAFINDQVSGVPSLCLVNADGTNFRALFDDDMRRQDPAWSPDGQQIAFTMAVDHPFSDIFVAKIDLLTVRRLTTSAGKTDSRSPAWRPLGTPRSTLR